MHCPIARATLALLASTLVGTPAIAADADQPAPTLVYCLQVQATGGECDDAAAEDARRLGPFINPDALLDTPEYAQSLDGLANDLAEYRYDNRLLGGGFIELDRILADMDFATETVTKGWFERFMEWLADKLDDGEQEDSALLDWLDQLTLPDWIAKAILWTSVGILVLGAIVIIVNEMRVAGVFNKRSSFRNNTTPDTSGDLLDPARWRAADIPSLPPLQQAIAMFSLSIAALRERELLPLDDSLTNGELARHLRRGDELRNSFDLLRRSADRALYADQSPAEQEIPRLHEAWSHIAGRA